MFRFVSRLPSPQPSPRPPNPTKLTKPTLPKQHKTLDVITLFHKSSIPSSQRALNLLKSATANAAETATEDQASDHTAQTAAQHKQKREEYELDVTEEPPTPDQLKSILDYLHAGVGLGQGKAGDVVKGAKDRLDAMRLVKEDGERFIRPVIVDWNNGKVIAGYNESAILKLVREIPPPPSDQ
ncbi:hypothetical protein AJ80_06358 [Polytolypa hystricis UAMH7299]|uniref:Thioredoxin-like fold domain-containing protein n=1 Tax=Polytolypa hystricis (strain UAMH7299) TaxID=1447883 RepID=A0A2B7XNM2_POLH7|nr:hypothetical protein AJ80_06358 [Polytolypa hystricis UAMH7299]